MVAVDDDREGRGELRDPNVNFSECGMVVIEPGGHDINGNRGHLRRFLTFKCLRARSGHLSPIDPRGAQAQQRAASGSPTAKPQRTLPSPLFRKRGNKANITLIVKAASEAIRARPGGAELFLPRQPYASAPESTSR